MCPAHAADVDWNTFPAYYELDEWSLDWSPVHGLKVEAHRIVRVNSSASADVGRIRIWDTFFQRLESFEGVLTDTLGHVLYTIGPKDVREVAPFVEFRLFSGDVIRAVDMVAPQPPYIFEARWTVKITNPFFWPDWVLGDRLPRRKASYQVAVPRRNDIRYQQVAPSLVRHMDKTARREIITWELRDWIVGQDLANTMGGRVTIPLLHVSPRKFRVGRHKGSTESWEALGKWYWKLTSGRLGLKRKQMDQTRILIRDLVGPRAQAAALKDWISDSWRYVAIEVGLGGWKPHSSKDVFSSRYGDCKDVVFLWTSMMRELGIEAYPALIRARNPLPVDPDFPKDWFDHVVAMSIIEGDTLWADPSDGRYRLGTLPRSCEERWALVVGEFGGKLVRTPCRGAAENRRTMFCEGTVDTEGNLDFQTRISLRGHYAQLLPHFGSGSVAGVEAEVLGITPAAFEGSLENADVVASDEVTTTFRGKVHGWAITDGQQMLVHPGLAGWRALDTLSGRPYPGSVDFPQTTYDTLVITFPAGWEPDFWPVAPFRSEGAGEFGEVRKFENGRLEIVRHLRWETCDRSEQMQRGYAGVRSAYRNAQNSDWVFRFNKTDSPADSDGARDLGGSGSVQPNHNER